LSYRLRAQPDKWIEIRTGDLRKWPGVDVWVNLENTNMQMSRLFDRTLSGMIRYHGARKDESDEIVEDTIAKELAEKLKGRESVALGTVFDTSAGALADSHQVKRVFHVAAVQGIPGEGYRAAWEIVDTCVSRCLQRMDSAAGREGGWRSIAFPMIGTGPGGGDVRVVAGILIGSALGYLRQRPDSAVAKVIFMARSRRHLAACQSALEALPELDRSGPDENR
jgi:O-acetyl-ADP-ribose deacetylase (regulator of RNase III)